MARCIQPFYLTMLFEQDATNASYDATVPARPLYRTSATASTTTPSFAAAEEHCSESPEDVPWTLDDPAKASNPSAMFSLGNVPMWDGDSITGK